MRKRLVIILAIILVFTGVFGGLFTWQYRKRREVFRADGYLIASEQYEDAVVCNYFTAGTVYRKSYGDNISFTSSMGTRERVLTKNFLHYSDTSISTMKASMVADLDEAEGGLLDFYYLAPQMVLASREGSYYIDNNGSELEFRDFIHLLDETKFMVRGDGIMTVSLANGQSQEVDGGYVEIIYPEENIVRIYNEDYIWQSIAEGCRIILANGVVIDLGTKTVYDSSGNIRFTIEDVAMDLASGSGIAVQSDSASQWAPPTFEFEVIDGVDGASGEDGQQGQNGTNGEDGAAGEDGMDNEDGEEGEDGEDGEEGDSGPSGASGSSGSAGVAGADGAQGTSGTSGASGASGANGAGGGTAGGGTGGSGGLGSALGRVIISQLEYDCSQVTFSFYAEDEDGILQDQGNYVRIIEKETSREVRRIELGEDGDAGTNFHKAIPEATTDDPITLTVGGLAPDTEYQILVYSNYQVDTTGSQASGNRAYASRSFFTASEGVTMSVQALSQNEVVIRLDKKDFSQARTARVYLSFEGTEEDKDSGAVTSVPIVQKSDTLDITTGTATYTFSAVDKNGESAIGGLTSNIPFSATLYTSSMTTTEGQSSLAWDDEKDGIPQGVEKGQVSVSKQKLEGTTLKENPEFGEVVCYQNAHGSYQIYLKQISDPDNAIESYIYRIYEYDSAKNTKTLVKTLSTINSTGVELYLDEDMFNKDYTIECEATYFDNEKTFTAQINGTLHTGTGKSIVTFIPAEVDSIQNTELKTQYSKYGTVGPTWMYGYLEIDLETAGFGVDWSADSGHEIMVQVASGEDYTRTLHYTKCSDEKGLDHFYDEAVTENGQFAYNKDAHKLFLPVNLWGLKADSYYTFSVTANVNYSDTTSALKNIGVGIYKTTAYSTQNKDVLPFRVRDITGALVNGDQSSGLTYKDMTFAISLDNNWTDGNYPIEVLSARAVEVTAYESKTGTDVPIKSFVIDLYQSYGLTESGDKPEDIWCNAAISPVARYLEDDPNYMKDSAERALVLFDTNLFGSTQGYGLIKLEVTGVYDYTYKENPFFENMESSNMGYHNEIEKTSQGDTFKVGDAPPTLPNNWEIVTAVPILNTNTSATGTYSIYDVLGNGQIDSALDSTTVRGYHLEADYTSSEIDYATYHIFTYDDWKDFFYWQSQTGEDKGTKEYQDIILAAREAEQNPTGPAAYWKDKVIEIEIDCRDFQSTSAPALNIIYDEDAPEKGTLDYTGAEICYYTKKIKRGQTYVAAFTAMDGFTRDEDTNEATYWYPYSNLGYGGGNGALLRSRPFRMDRQAPRVKLLWNNTSAEGIQEWEFYVYDPDMALGKITLKEEGKPGNELTTWDKLWDGMLTNKALEEGYIMAGHYDGNKNNSPLLTYTEGRYDPQSIQDSKLFPAVRAKGTPAALTDSDIRTIFTDVANYSQSNIASGIDMDKEGRSWKGKFTIDTSQIKKAEPESEYIFLGRSLNDSTYLTIASEEENGGLGWDSTNPTLYTMAAAQFRHSKVYFDEDIKKGLKVIPSLDSNNLNFKFHPTGTSQLVRDRIVALEATVWQATGFPTADQKPEDLKYKELGSKTIVYNSSAGEGIVANLEFSDFEGYEEGLYAFANIRAIYDTGMYGSAQKDLINETNAPSGSVSVSDGNGGDKTITLWKQSDGASLPYSLRQQEEAAWYTSSGTSLGQSSGSVANSVWNMNSSTFTNTATATLKVQRSKILASDTTNYREVTLTLRGRTATGTGELDTTSKFLEPGVGGWNDYNGTRANLVFGNIGISDGSFELDATSEKITGITSDIILKDEKGQDLVTLSAGQAVYFQMPRAVISTTGTNTTTQEVFYDRVTTKFSITNDSYNKLAGEGGKAAAYLPYIFVEVYEGTVYQGSAATTGDYVGYFISNKGKVVDKEWTDTYKYLTGPKSVYNELWGAAGSGKFTVNGEEKNLGSAFSEIAAIPVSKIKQVNNTYSGEFTISNLPSGGGSYPNYSVRLYVLPLASEAGIINYENINDWSELKNTIEKYKEYILDNASPYNDERHCYKTAMNVWWKLNTLPPAGITKIEKGYDDNSGYAANGYKDKSIRVAVTLNGASSQDTYLEFKICNSAGNVVLNNDEIMSKLNYTTAGEKEYTYFDKNGNKASRKYWAFYQGSNQTEFSYNGAKGDASTTVTLNIADFINQGKLMHGQTYSVYVRISHKNPTLVERHAAYTGITNIYRTDNGGLWCRDSNSIPEEAKNLVLISDAYASKKAEQYVNITIPAGYPPSLNANANYKTPNTGEGWNMNIPVSLIDNSYIAGVYKSGESAATAGEYRLKIYRETAGVREECTNEFVGSSGDYYATNTGRIFSKDNYQQYGVNHTVEAWGTTNGIKHISTGTCPCGQSHGAGDVDAEGNIMLGSETGMIVPEKGGIQIEDVEFTYSKTTGKLTMKVLSGVGYEGLKQGYTATVGLENGTAISVSQNTSSWNSNDNSCEIMFSGADRNKIEGKCTISIIFYRSNGQSIKVSRTVNL